MRNGKPFIIAAPDSFKGSLSASDAAKNIAAGVAAALPDAEIMTIPAADGGEGTVAALCGDCIRRLTVTGPNGAPVDAFYGFLPSGAYIIEMAAAAGLPLLGDKLEPLRSTTYGVGELMLEALRGGAKQIYLGLGGSATTDCGCGMAAALGVRFYNADGEPFVPTGETMRLVEHIDISGREPLLESVHISVMCDIENPLYGENGAAYVYAPQKGADTAQQLYLDNGLRHMADVILRDLGCDVSALPGGGAAGGCGAGVYAMLGGELTRGIDAVLEAKQFTEHIGDADLVISGEGRFDSQSICGKVIDGIARYTAPAGVPLAVLCGCDTEVRKAYDKGICAIFPIQRAVVPMQTAFENTAENLRRTAENVTRLFFAAKKK